MSEFKVKENTHIIIKVEDTLKYCSPKERDDLLNVMTSIVAGRRKDKKIDENSYYICNVDEPYSEKVLNVIKEGEQQK